MDKLKDNGFYIRYTHPNLLLISWKHWVPSYVRNELKKKTGIIIDEYGNKIDSSTDKPDNFLQIINPVQTKQVNTNAKKYTPITSYKPSGKLVYNDELLNNYEYKIK